MIKSSIFLNKNVIIVGMGRTGIGAAKSMIESGAQIIGFDDNPKVLEIAKTVCPSLQIVFDINDIKWEEINYVILSPGVPLYAPYPHKIVELANLHKVEIISDIDVLYLACPNATYIGVTGTNGKSTTTALINHIFLENGMKVQVGGNIGVSVLELVPQEEGYYILELSSYQLDLISYLHLDTALITNITADHIDRHGSFERYTLAKLKILKKLQLNGQAIISMDYINGNDLKEINKLIYISNRNETADIFIKDRVLHDKFRNFIFNFNDYTDLPGHHNEENIASAYTVAVNNGLSPQIVCESIKTFKGLDHRIQTVFKSSRFTFINDSKATNAEAAEKALCCYKNIYWIAGGIAKEGGIESLISLIHQNVVLTLLVGDAQNYFAETLAKVNLPFVLAGTIDKALQYLKSIANANGIVLLSPACASFDQYKDYEERGKEFKKLVIEKFSDD